MTIMTWILLTGLTFLKDFIKVKVFDELNYIHFKLGFN